MPDLIYADDGLPILQGTLEPAYRPGTRRVVGWQVAVTCPFCGQEHLHRSNGADLPAPGSYLGACAAQCAPGQSYHLLVKSLQKED